MAGMFGFRPTLDSNNRAFTLAFFGVSPLVGSITSFMAHIAVGWAVWKVLRGAFPLRVTRPILILQALFSLMTVLVFVTAATSGSPIRLYPDMVQYLVFAGFMPVIARLAVSPREDVIAQAAIACGLGGIAMAGYAIADLAVFARDRAVAGYGNPNVLGVAALVTFGLGLAFAGHAPRRLRGMVLVGIACAMACVFLSGMRIAMLCLPVVVAFATIAHLGRLPRLSARRISLIAGLSVLAVAVIAVVAAPLIMERLAATETELSRIEAGDFGSSLGIRIAMWFGLWPSITEAWAFGHGTGASGIIRTVSRLNGLEVWHAHNFILDALMSGGAAFLLVVVAIPFALANIARTAEPEFRLVAFAATGVLVATFYLTAMAGLLFGRDIHNALFFYGCVIIATISLPAAQRGPQGVT